MVPVARVTGAADLLGPAGPVASVLEAPEVRPAQLAMAEAVQRALETPGSRLMVEAPTGTGKSLAYLAAAALAHRPDLDRAPRVVVATGTRALQDQLADVDAPQLRRALRLAGLPDVNVEVVKGRRNYLCLLRLARWQPPVLGDPPAARMVTRIRRFAEETQVGDRAEVGELSDDNPLWNELDADGDACIGARCEHHGSCFITQLRARARDAHIIITNHHLLCADLRLRFQGDGVAEARVLPPYDALVIDEAHKLSGVAAEHFGMAVGPARVDALARDAMRMPGRPEATAAVRGAIIRLQRAGQLLFARVGTALVDAPDGARLHFEMARHPDVQQAGVETLAAVEDAHAQVEAHAAVEPVARTEAEGMARRLLALRDELAHLVDASDPRFAYCAERRGNRGRLMSYPADVSRVLSGTLLSGPEPVVFTSATLAVGGDFGPMRGDLGLPDDGSVAEVVLPHTFGPQQAVLYVPRDLPDPDAAGFAASSAERVRDLVEVTGGGAFLLCTTTRAMNAYAQLLAEMLPGLLVLRQGQAPKAELVARFKRDGSAVLVATHSFWEGVDVRGQALRLVVVDKLPFAPPHDPLVTARLQRAEREGRRPFEDVQLGDAVIALRQGLGRLIRSREDRGVLCVLDGRLWRRGYGKKVLGALSHHPLVHDWEDVLRRAEALNLRG